MDGWSRSVGGETDWDRGERGTFAFFGFFLPPLLLLRINGRLPSRPLLLPHPATAVAPRRRRSLTEPLHSSFTLSPPSLGSSALPLLRPRLSFTNSHLFLRQHSSSPFLASRFPSSHELRMQRAGETSDSSCSLPPKAEQRAPLAAKERRTGRGAACGGRDN